ncbi:MAG TPA: PQQ-dependent dehydrogenase, methanol/ethanol family [Allosphingosinicella sp.]|jgi:PQQ-dependent dehydrogenase (methanol/ethanol family)
MGEARTARHRLPLIAAALALPLAASAFLFASRNHAQPAPVFEAPRPTGAIPAAAASPPEDGQWTMPSKNPASTRYSGLDEVRRENVDQLKEAFSFDTLNRKGQEAAPIVVGSTMYITTPFPNQIWALDLANGGKPKWVFRPHPEKASQGIACCDVVNRGAMYANGRLYFTTLDGNVFAIDAGDGHQVWRAKLAEIAKGETITMSPLVVEGKVLVGNSGGEMGVRGWMIALDEGSGRIAWKAFSTGPDKDVLIGPGFKPWYASDRGTDLGVHSWPAEAWKIGGGTTWGWIAYDPALKTVFYGTGNPGPWNATQRPGDNKWTTGVFARDIATGQAKWFYQSSPHDLFDHDDINEQILLDMPIGGRMTPVLVRPGRNGYMYVIDRRTGQVYSADAYGFINAMNGVDLKTGRLQMVKGKEPKEGRVTRNICPTASGAKDWNPSAFSPRTGLLYVPHENICMDEGVMQANYIAGTPYVGADVKMYAGPGGWRGVFTAWDVVRRKPAWEVHEDLPLWSGALATAGDLVFYGTMDGWFKAYDAVKGRLLWKVHLDSGIISQPVTYRGPDGHQYVAVLTGVGGWAGAIVSAQLDKRDGSAALGMVNAMKDLPDKTEPGGRLHVFALPH